MESSNIPSIRTIILKLIGYILIFAIPTAVAAILLPKYAPYIMLIGAYMFLIVTGFLVGWEWDGPKLTTKNQTTLKIILQDTILLLILTSIVYIIERIIKSDSKIHSVNFQILIIAGIPAAILLPFCLARAIYRQTAFR